MNMKGSKIYVCYFLTMVLIISMMSKWSTNVNGDENMPYQEGWPIQNEQVNFCQPIIADIDNDGDLEIAVSRVFQDIEITYVWHHDGTNVTGFPKYVGGQTPALFDLNQDGLMEIIVVTYDFVYIWHHNGMNFTGWPQRIERELGTEIVASPPVICDIDQDGLSEILFITSVSLPK